MYRNTVAWFASAEQKPEPMCIGTSVNAAAQLVGAGIGIGVFPARMIEALRAGGATAPIITDPPLTIGRVYVADCGTADQEQTEAVTRTIERVTGDFDYFGSGS
jgi:DNA-binding transcriptional LysR family regulator